MNPPNPGAIEDEISKPYPDDDTAEACMVPIEMEWLNARICELEECPLDLPEAFASVWDRVKFKGEGCVTFKCVRLGLHNQHVACEL